MKKRNCIILFSLLLLSMSCVICVSAIQASPPMEMSQPYIYELRSLDNPITESEIIGLRDNLISKQKHLLRLGNGSKPIIASADPGIPDNGTIVAYGFYIDDEGMTHQMIGVVNNESCIGDIHEKAKQWLEKKDSEQNSLLSSDVPNGWTTLSEDDYYYEVEPYGLVENNFELYYNIEETDPDQDSFAVRQFFSMDPGFRRWREGTWSKWVSESGWCWNNWSYDTPTLNPSLHDRDPFGTHVGPTTLQLSLYPDPCISWSINLDAVTIEDNSDPATQTARWDMSIDSAEAQKTIQGWKVGSSIFADVPSAAGEYYLTNLWAQGRFVDPTSPWYDRQYYDIWTWWDLRVEYG